MSVSVCVCVWHCDLALKTVCVCVVVQGSIESLLCARVSDSMIGDKHNPNTELIAQVGKPQHIHTHALWAALYTHLAGGKVVNLVKSLCVCVCVNTGCG